MAVFDSVCLNVPQVFDGDNDLRENLRDDELLAYVAKVSFGRNALMDAVNLRTKTKGKNDRTILFSSQPEVRPWSI